MADNLTPVVDWRELLGIERDSVVPAISEIIAASPDDIRRRIFRKSKFPGLWLLAITNDDGSPIISGLPELLSLIHGDNLAIASLLAATLKVDIQNERLPVKGEIYTTTPALPIAAGSVGGAYANLDAIGTTPFTMKIPRAGHIQSATMLDPSDQGQPVSLWLFTAAPATQTDNSAMALTDAELATTLYVVYFGGMFHDGANGQVTFVESIGKSYKLPTAQEELVTVYCLVQARGTPTVTVSTPPSFTLDILVE